MTNLILGNLKYWLYGLTLLGGVGVAEWRGYSFTSLTERKVAPKSVRDNPGAYRSSYSNYTRYSGGK
ncbi:MAG: hypothetical protein K2X03_29335 [Bryobacteraceae bacterium]|nr:hypothetical protein [Bryobacteraceae bacterium]